MKGIRLFDLANLAIGTPEVGAVNFTALHTLLHAIIKHLHVQDVSAELPDEGTRRYPPAGGKLVKGEEKGQEGMMEHRILHMEKQLEALNNFPSGLDIIERSHSGQQGGSRDVEDMWQMMQLKRRLEVNEEGVCKAMTVLQDLMLEVETLKDSQHEVQDQIQKVTEAAGLGKPQQLSQVDLKTETKKDVENVQKELELLKTRMDAQTSFTSQPSDIDISPMSEPIQGTDLSQPDEPLLDTSQTMRSQAQGSTQTKDPVNAPHVTQDGMSASTLEDSQMGVSGQQHERDLTHSHPGAPVPEDIGINPSMTSMDCTPAPGPPGVNLAHPSGATSMEQAMLYIRLDALERDKADRTELGLLQRNTDDLAKTVPDMQEKMSSLYKEMQDLRGDRDKLDQLQRAMDPIVTQLKLEETSQINQQLGYLSATIEDSEKELKELRDRQVQEKVTMEQSGADKYRQLQDQLNQLRGILTTMASSSSTLLAMSIPEQSESCTPPSNVTPEPELPALATMQTQPPVTTTTSKEHLTCPACSIDIGKKVSKLVSDYEHLQKLVTDYTSKEAAGKDLQGGRRASNHYIQDSEVIAYIKNTMVQLQEECEQLNKTTKSLHEQKQQHIDILYQAVGTLENKKADKEQIGLEIDVKADKRSLESKVSRTHFDATTEHLNHMIQELLGKVSTQEQDWQRLLEKINVEMQNKLDRMEIDPLKNILEERWKNLCRQLQEHPTQYVADEAAVIRKQLMKRFHCISCDRTVDMMVPGPAILTIPKMSGLPARHSNRPYTVFELNQVRQQSHRLKSGIYQARCEFSQLELSINHLRRIHSHMRQEIARVQLHFGGSDTRKIISHLLQAHCATLGKFSKNSSTNQRIDDLSSSRNCGGSHTLKLSQRRYTKFQVNSPCSVQKKDTAGAGLKAGRSINFRPGWSHLSWQDAQSFANN
ncbi:glutamine-rich protein 2-like isoform X2 [Rhinoderma darwinii]|uniref:glutamine-rich protein 2-like isoform X2 n=1 Tax=Rhinoderma darwinii TaxID=43563 RepID=UPI003F674E3C